VPSLDWVKNLLRRSRLSIDLSISSCANGIMPLPTPPNEKRKATGSPQPDVPVKDEEPEEEDDDPDLAEARALEAQLKAIRQKISKKGHPAKRIKLESSSAASSILVPRPGEVIDLT